MKRTSNKPVEHSQAFWDNKYQKYLDQFNDLVESGKPVYDQIELDKGTFISNWKAMEYINKGRYSADMTRDIINTQRYGTQHRTARALQSAIENETGIKVKIKDIKQMSHESIIDSYGTDISRMYASQVAMYGKKEASKFISQYWFGS